MQVHQLPAPVDALRAQGAAALEAAMSLPATLEARMSLLATLEALTSLPAALEAQLSLPVKLEVLDRLATPMQNATYQP